MLTSLMLAVFAATAHGGSQDSPSDRRVVSLGDRAELFFWSEGATRVPHYRVEMADGRCSRRRSISYDLHLRTGSFDPLGSGRVADEPFAGSVYIVQFLVPPLEFFETELGALGASVQLYLPQHSYLVTMEGAVREQVAALPYVRWVGPYRAEYRFQPTLRSDSSEHYLIQVMERTGHAAQVADRLQARGVPVDRLAPRGLFLGATLTPDQFDELVTWDEVLYVSRWGSMSLAVNNVRADGGADALESVTGWSGEGVRGEVLDSEIWEDHFAFQSPPAIIHGDTGPGGAHGTEVAGIVFGDGTGNPSGRGLLPDAQPIFSARGDAFSFDLGTHIDELLLPSYEAVFQTNSWFYASSTSYDAWSALVDDAVFRNDIVLLYAMGNWGTKEASTFAWGKNVVSVGGVMHFDTLDTSDDKWAKWSSHGPAEDNRIKPDLCFWFDKILTTRGRGAGYTDSFGGTSAATPQVAGHFGLVFQMWHEGVFGDPGGATVFESRPHSTTARALVINSANQYTFSGAKSSLRRTHQGWGRPDVERLYDRRDRTFVINESAVLRNLETATFTLRVPVGETELRATLVYLDPVGAPGPVQRVNDLSLRATSPSGVAYWGNHGLRGNMYSTAGGSSNDRDTVENVWIANPEVGLWTVEVLADEVNRDSHVETVELDADFALVVSGVESCAVPTRYCTASANSSGGPARMTWTGSPSILANDLVLGADQAPPNQIALFFYGRGQTHLPLGDGFLCVGGPLHRLGPIVTDAAGTASWPFDNSSVDSTIVNGSTLRFQLWFRDPAAGGAGSNLSDGLSVTFCQ